MRPRNRRWILLWFLLSILQLVTSEDNVDKSTSAESATNGDKSQRSIFNPRMDYDQWKPLGRGDPLKNDPTYDYVPPVLDRVHYWVEPAMRKPDAILPGDKQKTEILLLGITSKKPASGPVQADSRKDTYDSYTKYVESAKYNPNQRIARPSFIPSIPTSFFPSLFNQNKNKYADRAAFSKGNEQRVPFTMLMPPPPDNSIHPLPHTQSPPVNQAPVVFQVTPSITTQRSVTPLTAPSVSVQPANLIYHSSSLGSENEFRDKQLPTISTSVSWEEPTTNKDLSDFRDDLVYSTNLAPPESYIRIEFAPNNFSNKPLIAADSNHNINYVTPPPLLKSDKEVMFKGQVSDDNMDISNTYVKIGKPEAEVHSSGIGVSNMGIDTIIHHSKPLMPTNMMMYSHIMKPAGIPPVTMEELQDMQTMHPPPVTQSPVFTSATNSISKMLDNENVFTPPLSDINMMTPNPYHHILPPIDNTMNVKHPAFIENSSSILSNGFPKETTILVSTTMSPRMPITSSTTTTTSTTVSPTTTMTSLTTDPLFKHYNQPIEPLKGPLYLIIEGHSKVKTYGPSKEIHGIMVQETNEISDNEDIKYEKNFEVKHLHGFQRDKIDEEVSRKGRNGNIQTLKHVVQTGFGAIDFAGIDSGIRRKDDDFKETEVQAGYEIVDSKDATTHAYHKGIVEEARKLKL